MEMAVGIHTVAGRATAQETQNNNANRPAQVRSVGATLLDFEPTLPMRTSRRNLVTSLVMIFVCGHRFSRMSDLVVIDVRKLPLQ